METKKIPGAERDRPAGANEKEVSHSLPHSADTVKKRSNIYVSATPELHILSRKTWEGIVAAGRPVYQTEDGLPVRVRNTEAGAGIETLTQDSLRHEASHSNRYLKSKPGDDGNVSHVEVLPPVPAMKDALASAEMPLPVIAGIIKHPTIAGNGKIINYAGYNPENRLYIDADEKTLKAAENIPAAPAALEISEAVRIFDDVIADFPFVGAADRAGFFAMCLTMLARPIIEGLVPAFLIKAPTPGTGKSLLAASGIRIAVGRAPAPTPWVDNEEEIKKSIFSLLLSGGEYIFIDNVTAKLTSATLAALLTSGQLNARILGFSRMATAKCGATIIITANNPELSREIARRCVPIGLASNFENPSERTGFNHSDLSRFVDENRPGLIRAGLTMARAWFADECDSSGVKTLASFEGWSRTVGGILKSCGIGGFLENTEDFFTTAEGDAESITAFVRAWYGKEGHFPVLVRDILPLAVEHGLVNDKNTEASQKKSLGQLLRRKQDMVFSGIKITRCALSAGNLTWKTEAVSPEE